MCFFVRRNIFFNKYQCNFQVQCCSGFKSRPIVCLNLVPQSSWLRAFFCVELFTDRLLNSQRDWLLFPFKPTNKQLVFVQSVLKLFFPSRCPLPWRRRFAVSTSSWMNSTPTSTPRRTSSRSTSLWVRSTRLTDCLLFWLWLNVLCAPQGWPLTPFHPAGAAGPCGGGDGQEPGIPLLERRPRFGPLVPELHDR